MNTMQPIVAGMISAARPHVLRPCKIAPNFSSSYGVQDSRRFSAQQSLRRLSSHTVCASKERHVVVFPWFGARSKDIRKYQDYWKQKGATCLILRPNIAQNMLPWLAKAFAKRAYHEIERVEGPLIVHTFSNGGFFMLSTVLQHAHLHASEKEEEDRFRPRVEKIIFDSCPSLPMRAETLAGALVTLFRSKVHDVEEDSLYPFLLKLSGAFLNLPPIKHQLNNLQGIWSGTGNNGTAPVTPQLFLYSYGDSLVTVTDVEIFAQEQVLRGCVQNFRCWKESLHVQHFRQDPSGYHSAIESFLSGSKVPQG